MTYNTTYDAHFAGVSHYRQYPLLYPWVGREFASQSPRILVLGESHYLKRESVFHHDAAAWYAGVEIPETQEKDWIYTRQLISRGIANRWRQKSKLIYSNIERALGEAGLSGDEERSPFQRIAFMNYFQRPAQVTGNSIVVSDLDRKHSAIVLSSVLYILKPQIVIFSSALAWESAQELRINRPEIRFVKTTHPATRWWHTRMKKYKGQSGKEIFIQALQPQLGGNP